MSSLKNAATVFEVLKGLSKTPSFFSGELQTKLGSHTHTASPTHLGASDLPPYALHALDTCKRAEVLDEYGHESSNQDLGISGHLRPPMKLFSFPASHISHVKVQINFPSPGKLKGMSVLTKSVTDNLKKS